MASAALVLSPGSARSVHGKPFALSIGELVRYRGVFRPVRGAPPRGGTEAWLANRVRSDAFNFGEVNRDEIERLLRMCQQYGGDFLALWTYGDAVHTLLARNPEPGAEPAVREINLRLEPYGASRSEIPFERLCAWFDGTAFDPDLDALRREYRAARLSVRMWFKAFGISGAHEVRADDPQALWDELERSGLRLLAGETVTTRAVRQLNRATGATADREKLRCKPLAGPGKTARRLARAIATVHRRFGPPVSDSWATRFGGAAIFRDLARDRLTAGSDAAGLGQSASLGRLLDHYPASLMRDPLFHVVAAIEAEAHGGQAYADGLLCLAEHAASVGFTRVTFPARLQRAFRERFGIVGADGPSVGDGAEEVFVDVTGVLKVDPTPSIDAWFASHRADGFRLRMEPGGERTRVRYDAGAPRGTDVAGPQPLGRTDPPASRATPVREDPVAGAEPLPVAVASAARVLVDHDRALAARGGFPLTFRIVLPAAEERHRRGLALDLSGRGCVDRYGEVRVVGHEVVGTSRGHVPKACFVRLLGDLPDGARVLVHADGRTWHYTIAGRLEPPQLECGDLCYGWSFEGRHGLDLDGELDRPWAGRAQSLLDDRAFADYVERGIDDWSIVVDELLRLEGRSYLQLDLRGVESPHEQRLRAIEHELEELGLRRLGDLVSTARPDLILRGFAAAAGDVYGVVQIPPSAEPTVEFYSTLADGSALAATTTAGFDEPAPRTVRHLRLGDQATVRDLWERHRGERMASAARGNAPRPMEPRLRALAETCDRLLTQG